MTFNYGKITQTYTKQKREDGTGGGNVPAGWDLQANKPVLIPAGMNPFRSGTHEPEP